jgi:malonyl-CoA decarboxylase
MAKSDLIEEKAPAPQAGSSRLNRFLNSVADAGLDLLRSTTGAKRPPKRTLLQHCHALLSTTGEASGTAIARAIVEGYRALETEARIEFLGALAREFDVDADAILAAGDSYRNDRSLKSLLALSAAVEPARQELFRRINTAPDGIATIVEMRRDLRRALDDHPELAAVEADLRHLLISWFNRGFLELRRIDWNTPAAILEKLIRYETVHAIESWEDLHRRLDSDRRCFAFFHPALPDEPLIFVEIALVRGLASAIPPLLDRLNGERGLRDPDTAIFYSINNCQEGLKGISFGDFLIKQVVLELARDLPSLKTFATLSPIPKFRSWLTREMQNPDSALVSGENRAALQAMENDAWIESHETREALEALLLRLCAAYLLEARQGDHPVDPVARFHLRNGARLERINWLGDPSSKGLRQSASLLANYVYDLDSIERNHEAYVVDHKVIASAQVTRLLGNGRR